MDPITQKILEQQLAIRQDPNFSLYQPSNIAEPLNANETLGIAPLVSEKTTMPDLKKVAGNVIRNKAIDYAASKLGMNNALSSGLAGIIGIGQNTFAPLTAISALSGRSLGISDYLSNKRSQKQAIKANLVNDKQGNIVTYPTGIMSIEPTSQDLGRGSYGQDTRADRTNRGVTSAQFQALRK